jgi:hypothetical protein
MTWDWLYPGPHHWYDSFWFYAVCFLLFVVLVTLGIEHGAIWLYQHLSIQLK